MAKDGGRERAKGRQRVAQNRSTARTRAEIGTYATRGGRLEQLTAMGESFNATFVNPVVNAVGQAVGRSPNLRQAGPLEAAVNTLGFVGGPVGRVAGRGIQSVGRAIANTGVPARVINRLTGQQVLVHGSPTQGITTINPTRGHNRGRGTRGVDLGLQGFYGVPGPNPQFGPNVAMKYALGDQDINIAQGVVGQGSIYIAKAKKSDLIYEGAGKVARTSQPAKVVAEIRLSDIPRSNPQLAVNRYVEELRRAGGPVVPREIRKLLPDAAKVPSRAASPQPVSPSLSGGAVGGWINQRRNTDRRR